MAFFGDLLDDLGNIPIGVYKDNLENAYCNFKENFFNKITASDIVNTKSFTMELLSLFNSFKKAKTYLIDASDEIKDNYLNIVKYNNNLDAVLQSVNDNIDKIYTEYEQANFDNNVILKYQPMLFVIYDFNKFKQKLTVDLNSIITNLFQKNEKLHLINFIVIDSVDNFKKIEFDPWFKQVSQPDNAIWIGEGISTQYTIKLLKSTDRTLQTPIPNDFGYLVVNGKHALIKVLTFDKNNLDNINEKIKSEQTTVNNEIEEL